MQWRRMWFIASMLALGVFVVAEMGTPANAASCSCVAPCDGLRQCWFTDPENPFFVDECRQAIANGKCITSVTQKTCEPSGTPCGRVYYGVDSCTFGPQGTCGDDASVGDRC